MMTPWIKKIEDGVLANTITVKSHASILKRVVDSLSPAKVSLFCAGVDLDSSGEDSESLRTVESLHVVQKKLLATKSLVQALQDKTSDFSELLSAMEVANAGEILLPLTLRDVVFSRAVAAELDGKHFAKWATLMEHKDIPGTCNIFYCSGGSQEVAE